MAAAIGFLLTCDALTRINPEVREYVENIQKQFFVHESDFNGTYMEFVPKALRWELANVLSFEFRVSGINVEALKMLQQFIGMDNLNTVVLKRNLTNLSGKTYSFDRNITTLDLSSNQIREIDRDAFIGLENLVRLHLEENQITHLEGGVFTPLYNLKYLRLNSNSITEVQTSWFPENFKLEELFLRNNRITHLAGASFVNLPNLNNLHLAHNQLQTLDEEAFRGLTSLKYLILRNNFIVRLPLNIFGGLSELSHLDLSDNLLEFIDSRAFRTNEKLFEVILSRNRITSFHPDTLVHLEKLKSLELSENQLVEYNFQGVHAQYIRLTDNHLTELQFNANATHIKAESNQIERVLLPSTMKLYDLQAAGNKIQDLRNITAITTLKSLYISNNSITSLPGDFHKLTLLSFLDLSHNHLTHLSFDSWPRNITMASLSELWINGNNFSHLPLEFLDFFPNVTHLNLCDNPWNSTFLMEFDAECRGRNITLIGSNSNCTN